MDEVTAQDCRRSDVCVEELERYEEGGGGGVSTQRAEQRISRGRWKS